MNEFNKSQAAKILSCYLNAENIIEKGRKAFPIGTVRNGFEKISEDEWKPVKSNSYHKHEDNYYYKNAKTDKFGDASVKRVNSKTGDAESIYAADLPKHLHEKEEYKKHVESSNRARTLNEAVTGNKYYSFHGFKKASKETQDKIIQAYKEGKKIKVQDTPQLRSLQFARALTEEEANKVFDKIEQDLKSRGYTLANEVYERREIMSWYKID